MSDSVKRKAAPDDRRDERGGKRSKVSAGRSLTLTFAITFAPGYEKMLLRLFEAYKMNMRFFSLISSVSWDLDRVYTDMMQGGSGRKWQTPHQRAKAAMVPHQGNGNIEPGDMGIWATCVKGKEGAATEELKSLFEEVCITSWPRGDSFKSRSK